MKSLKKIITGALVVAAFAGTGLVNAASVALNGAGSTFDYPIFSKWFYEYNKANGIEVNYQSIGSGGGIQQFISKTVDFGATDAYLTDEETEKAGGKVLNIPVVMGAVCVSYNIPGIDSGLKLTPAVLTGIYLGDITKWNDPAITVLNPDLNLPDLNITVAHRSDGSGTTNIFTNYLTKVSTKWASSVGWGKAVKWPVGVGGKGNEGVAGLIKQIPGTIGYIELAYAKQNSIPYAKLKNRSGNFVEPSIDGTTEAAKGALHRMPSDFKIMITDAPGEEAYPICGFSWVVVRVKQSDPGTGKAIVDLLNWMMDKGNSEVADLYYAPFPDSLVEKIKSAVATIKY